MLVTTGLLLVVFSSLCSGAGNACRSGWVSHAGSCYHFSHDQEDWINAEDICVRFGATLAEVETAEEDTFLQNFVNTQKVNYWLGATDLENENEWVWMNTNTLLQYTNWAPTQPSNTRLNENCMELKPNTTGWNDAECSSKQHYICETRVQAGQVIG